MSVIALSPFDLSIAALLILTLAGLSLRLKLGVEKQLLWAAARSTIQLLLIGLVLKALFAHVQLGWVALMAAVTLQLGRASLVDPLTVGLAFVSGALVWLTRINTTWLVLLGALAGVARNTFS